MSAPPYNWTQPAPSKNHLLLILSSLLWVSTTHDFHISCILLCMCWNIIVSLSLVVGWRVPTCHLNCSCCASPWEIRNSETFLLFCALCAMGTFPCVWLDVLHVTVVDVGGFPFLVLYIYQYLSHGCLRPWVVGIRHLCISLLLGTWPPLVCCIWPWEVLFPWYSDLLSLGTTTCKLYTKISS